MSQPDSDAAIRQQLYEQHVYLLAPSFGAWQGRYQLDGASVTVEIGSEAVGGEDDSLTTPQAKLIRKTTPVDAAGQPWKKRMDDRRAEYNRLLKRYTVTFPLRGIRQISTASLDTFLRELRTMQTRIRAMAEEFVAGWGSIRAQFIQHTQATVWAQIEERIPSLESIRNRFYVDVTPIRMAAGELRQFGDEDLTLAREAVQRKVNQAIELLVAEPRQELAQALGELEGLIQREGRVTSKSFRPVQAAVEKLRLFQFAADPELLDRLNQLEAQLQQTAPADVVNHTAIRAGFLAAAQDIRRDLTDVARMSRDREQFGRARRDLDL